MRPAPFAYHEAESVEDMLGSLGAGDGDTVLLAGGQSLIPLLATRSVRPRRVLDIDRLSELEHLSGDAVEGPIRIGALCRHATLERSASLTGPWAAWRSAAKHVGLHPVRLRGTLGGSLAHAHPGAELALAAVTYDAVVHIRSRQRERTLPVAELLLGPHRTALDPDEAIMELRVSERAPGTVSAFAEAGRSAVGWPLASVCVVLGVDGGEIVSAALGVGAVGPVPLRVAAVEAVLVGSRLDASSVAAAAVAAARAMDDVAEPGPHLDADSRRELVATLVRRSLDQLRTEQVAA